MSSLNGVLLIDKPEGPSSRDVLDALEPRLGAGPLGHSGTLDPLASGLLVVLIGRARKLQEYFTGRPKRYAATVRFGASTPTFDRESDEVPALSPPPDFTAGFAEALLSRFRGETDQRPPAFSAVRIGGRRSHEMAREGRAEEPPARRIRIDDLVLTQVEGADWSLEIACSAGTFIRSLARDLGIAAGTTAYLTRLRRSRSGCFDVALARAPEDVRSEDVMSLSAALASEPRVDVSRLEAVLLRDGRALAATGIAEDSRPAFAWLDGSPRCKLKRLDPPLVRADLFFEPL